MKSTSYLAASYIKFEYYFDSFLFNYNSSDFQHDEDQDMVSISLGIEFHKKCSIPSRVSGR
ncbi:hypothetical protein V1477_008668 [Vespula maculifrons]|uniref:Uncharacterized protein n=1 Tax=Vespula maculifrons TaxID=7453 RepID=A0ABD2CE33_VESMC